jgi:hypothetical protein
MQEILSRVRIARFGSGRTLRAASCGGGYKICEVEYQVGEWNAGGGVVKVVGCCVRCGRFVRVARANRGVVPRIQGALRQCQRVDLSVWLRAREKYWKLLEPRSLPM